MAEFLCPYEAWEPWRTPDTVLSSGPDSALVEDADLLDLPPASGRVGFTVEPGPVRVAPPPDASR